jgi:hypothetical protein
MYLEGQQGLPAIGHSRGEMREDIEVFIQPLAGCRTPWRFPVPGRKRGGGIRCPGSVIPSKGASARSPTLALYHEFEKRDT